MHGRTGKLITSTEPSQVTPREPPLPGGFTRGHVWATEEVRFIDGSMVQKHTKGYILGASTTSPAKWLQVSWEHRGDGRTGKLITASWPYHLTPREPPLPWVRVSDAVTLPIQCLIEAVLTAEPCALSCLGLQPHLTHPKKTIRARFRVLAIRLHPDKESHSLRRPKPSSKCGPLTTGSWRTSSGCLYAICLGLSVVADPRAAP